MTFGGSLGVILVFFMDKLAPSLQMADNDIILLTGAFGAVFTALTELVMRKLYPQTPEKPE